MGIRIRLSEKARKQLQCQMAFASNVGDFRLFQRTTAIMAVGNGQTYEQIASILKVTQEAIRIWVRKFLVGGVGALKSNKSKGRKPKLTKTQKKELAKIIEESPTKAGYSAACWRSPMIQDLIYRKYGVAYSVNYIAQLLKNMGFSYQKARFVSDHLNEKKREEWLKEKWPEIQRLAKEKKAMILFGDEASFPQWGTLSYTWARKGAKPTVKTSGKRKGYKVFGAIDYFTGSFFWNTTENRLNSDSYREYLSDILSKVQQHIILVQDGAKYHTSKATRQFIENNSKRITAFQLPSYSPDYNPIEKLWKNIKQKETHLHYFPTFQALIDKIKGALRKFENLTDEILKLFGFYQRRQAIV